MSASKEGTDADMRSRSGTTEIAGQVNSTGTKASSPDIATVQPISVVTDRTPLLFAVLAVLLAALLYMLSVDGGLSRSMGRLLRPLVAAGSSHDWTKRFASDPQIGSQVTHPAFRAKVRRAAASVPVGFLLVALHDCASCVRTDFAARDREALSRGLTPIFISTASEDSIKDFRTDRKLIGPIIRDEDGVLHKRLNSFWRGRSYLFSPDWRMLWIEKDFRSGKGPFVNRMLFTSIEELGK
jgi:hypothetical protein